MTLDGQGTGREVAAPIVVRGVVCCPRCEGKLVGYLDVTVHPTIRLNRAGRVAAGRLQEDMAAIRRAARWHGHQIFLDEVYCDGDECGYHVKGYDLQALIDCDDAVPS